VQRGGGGNQNGKDTVHGGQTVGSKNKGGKLVKSGT
jgi:hypothetical protein